MLDDLEARGMIANVTDREALGALLAKESISLYAGYDPTASSLHVGNLVPTIMLKRFQLAGHRPIIVVGGATGMVGDPSGKSDERNLLDDATLAANLAGIRGQLARLLDVDDPKTGALVVNNADWTRGVSFLEFLRDIGKHLTINYMMAKDSVKSRLEGEAGMSYTEFSYMLLQAFDFVELSRSHHCRLQVGGNDQYGNITAGCELSHKLRGPQLFGLTAPLLLDSSGNKMGKSMSGERIWLDAERTTPYAFYQYWFNRPDDEMPRMLKMFSLRPLSEITELLDQHDADRAKRLAQRELAVAMTTWIHGAEGLARAETATKVMFGGDLAGITDGDLLQLVGSVPTINVARTELEAGLSIVDLFARAPLAADKDGTARPLSKGESRKLVESGGASLNNVKVAGIDQRVTLANLATETMLVLRKGKRDYCLVRVG
ncbi:MAG: tyrosine--tRNA ligase [Deltaproteobacteria bacterium]|nr:tyrosine--tRNA ligase [Deltaproteobacteria bacterium]